jgi:hypothetical protein
MKAKENVLNERGSKHSQYETLQNGWKHITYSVFDTVSGGGGGSWVVTNNLAQLAVEGKCIVIAEAGWSGDGKEYRSKPIENPTWRVLARHADKSVPVTNNRHHTFFEGCAVTVREDGIKEVKLVFGS